MWREWRGWFGRPFRSSRNRPTVRGWRLEALEDRLAPAVDIGGTVFDDRDGNGTFGTGESGVSGVTVFLDADGDGAFDLGETSTNTDAEGAYSFADLGPGTYRPRVVPPSGTTQTTADAELVASTTDLTGVDFGLFATVTISGTVYDDADGDGARGSGEAGVQGVTVFLDADGDGAFDLGETSTNTDADGAYSFADLGPGTYRPRVVPPSGTTQTTADPDVTASSGSDVGGVDFGLFTTVVTISGTVYDDADGDGTRDSGEAGVQGVTVFLDADGDGAFDLGETSTNTDADGAYSFADLSPGTYHPRVVPPSGTAQTTADAELVASTTDLTGVDFGLFATVTISGTVYDDADGDGARGSGEAGVQGVTVFLDADGDGAFDLGETSTNTDAEGAYSFADLGPGLMRVREVAPSGTVVTTPDIDVTPTSGTDITGKDIGTSSQSLSIAATSPTTSEGSPSAPGVFTITRTGSTAAALTVTYSVAGSATNGVEYLTLSGTAVIPAGQTSVTVAVTPLDDSISEGAETVALTLNAAPGLTLSAATATVTIADNETTLTPGSNRITLVSADGRSLVFSGVSYGPVTDPIRPFAGFGGGVASANGDFTGDGVPDLVFYVSVAGAGHVKVFDAVSLAEVASFFAFDTGYVGGLSVASGDVNGDGRADLIVAAASGAGGHVKVIDGTKLRQVRQDGVIADSALLYSFKAFEAHFGAVRMTAGNVDSDGSSDIVVAAVTSTPHVKVLSGQNLSLLSSFMLAGGAGLSLAVGDRNNDGRGEVYAAFEDVGDTSVRIYNGLTGRELGRVTPFAGYRGELSLDTLDGNNDGRIELAIGSASGVVSHLMVIDLLMGELASFYVPALGGGIRVSGQ